MIDELDRKLIKELQKDGRQTYVELAGKLGVVEGTVRKRVKTLIDNNMIQIVAVPNMGELGYKFISTMALQVKMADLRKVADTLTQKPNVCRLAFITGRYDLMALIVTRSPQELSCFIEDEISAITSILRTETFVELDVIKGGWLGIDTTQLISNLDVSSLKRKWERTNEALSP